MLVCEEFFLVIPDFGCTFSSFFVTGEDRTLCSGCFAGSPRIITVNYRLFGLLKFVRVLIGFFIGLKFGVRDFIQFERSSCGNGLRSNLCFEHFNSQPLSEHSVVQPFFLWLYSPIHIHVYVTLLVTISK